MRERLGLRGPKFRPESPGDEEHRDLSQSVEIVHGDFGPKPRVRVVAFSDSISSVLLSAVP